MQHPIVLQIGGSDVSTLANATRLASSYGYDEINLKYVKVLDFTMLHFVSNPGLFEDSSNEFAVVDAQVRKLLVMVALVHGLCLTLRYILVFYSFSIFLGLFCAKQRSWFNSSWASPWQRLQRIVMCLLV